MPLPATLRSPHRRAPGWPGSLLLLVLLAGCLQSPERVPTVRNGVLDLRAVSLDQVVPLRGEWLSHAGEDDLALAAFGYDDSHWRPVTVAGYFKDQGYPDEGLVWYRLHLRFPPDAPLLKGYLQHADNAHALYVARPGAAPVQLAASGHPARSPEATIRSRRPVTFLLQPDTALVLSWQVANYDYLNGGPFFAIQLGSVEAMNHALLKERSLVLFTCGLFMMLAFFFLFEWVWRRDPRSLAVGLLAALMGLRTLALSGLLEQLAPGLVTFDVRILLEGGTYLAMNGLFAIVFWSFFPREFLSLSLGRLHLRPPVSMMALEEEISGPPRPPAPRWRRTLNTVLSLFAILVSAVALGAALPGDPHLTSHVIATSRWITLMLIPLALFITLQALERRRPLAVATLLGFLPVLIGGVHDLLLAQGFIMGSVYVSNHAILFFILVLGFAVAHRGARYARQARLQAQRLEAEVLRRTEALQDATQAAQAANAAKSRFVSAVSHELRTPLTAMLGYTEVLAEELNPSLQSQHREFFEMIRKSGRRLLVLVNDLLDIARIESGHLNLTTETVALLPLVQDTLAQIRPLAQEKGLALHEPDAHLVHARVQADEARLRQVLLNLLANAVKFTEVGQVGVQLRSTRFRDAPAWAIAVYDTGMGIAPEFMPELFKAFSQEPRTYAGTERGTGLGLTLARELVEKMQGTIEVESALGRGSTFTLILPAAAPVSPSMHPTGAPDMSSVKKP